MLKITKWLFREREKTSILLRSIPATVMTLFVVSVICMNLLANKTLLQLEWIALDGGILISWLSFMCMDIITKYFGPKASNKIAILASGIGINSHAALSTDVIIGFPGEEESDFADTMDIPVKFIGVGEQVDDLVPFDAQAFVEALI